MDKDIKKEAEMLFAEMGINMSTAINIFVRQSVRQKKIPFEISAEKPTVFNKKDRREAFGCLKGKIHVPENFNEPLEDFEEYMR